MKRVKAFGIFEVDNSGADWRGALKIGDPFDNPRLIYSTQEKAEAAVMKNTHRRSPDILTILPVFCQEEDVIE